MGWGDNGVKSWFQPVIESFGPNFIKHVAKANGSKLSHSLRVFNFRDKHKIRVVKFKWEGVVIKEIKHTINNSSPKNKLIFMIE